VCVSVCVCIGVGVPKGSGFARTAGVDSSRMKVWVF